MNKRKNVIFDEYQVGNYKKPKEVQENIKKHSLDSDEEDDDVSKEAYNVMDDDDFEGEEEGYSGNHDGVRTTAFNMREEMEEGHFDKDGHFLWKKDKDIRDNWLDNIDWHQIAPRDAKYAEFKSLGAESDSESDEEAQKFNEIQCYRQILEFLQPMENITKALRRLGGAHKKLSSVERLKMKKAGTLDCDIEKVIRLTELANNILNQTGNMDIYQETYEYITEKINKCEKKTEAPKTDALDMYSDDFDTKEKVKLFEDSPSTSSTKIKVISEVMWEIKWKQESEEIEGPKTSVEMQKYVDDGKFKTNVWVRRTGQEEFYSASRIDFQLYIS